MPDYAEKEWVDIKLANVASEAHLKLMAHIALDDQRFEAAQDAMTAAASDIDRRLASMNQFREQLRDQATTLLPREIYDREHEVLRNRVEALERALNEDDARADERQAVLAGISSTAQALRANRNWLIGLVVTSCLTALTLLLHLAKFY